MSVSGQHKTALCLSGGGFRASLFHLGALRRLNEMGILSRIDAFSSVSGGSITSAVLATRWDQLNQSESEGVFTAFDSLVAQPIYDFCQQDLRTDVLLWQRLDPGNWWRLLHTRHTVTDRLATAYAEDLGLNRPLSTLPAAPQFIFCAANLANGVSWEFRSRKMGDFYTGWASTGDLPVARAVAASSAYPVTFPPLVMSPDEPLRFDGGHDGSPLSRDSVALTDGGVYDNLGLEPVNTGYRYLLVSDAATPMRRVDGPSTGPYGRLARSFDVIWNQVGALRKRWLIAKYKSSESDLSGAYWGIASDVAGYGLDAPGYGRSTLELLARVRTDLDAFTLGEIACLENQGYSLANVAIRRWVVPLLPDSVPEFRWPHREFADDAKAAEALQDSGKRGLVEDLWRALRQRMTPS